MKNPPPTRFDALARVASGVRVSEVAKILDVPAPTIYGWRRESRQKLWILADKISPLLTALAASENPNPEKLREALAVLVEFVRIYREEAR